MKQRLAPRYSVSLGLCAAMLVCSPTHAQRSRLTVSGGVTHLQYQDLIHTPFIHGGVSPLSSSVRYERARTWAHFAEAGYATATSRVSEAYPIRIGAHEHQTPPHRYHIAHAAYGAGHHLRRPGQQNAVLGAALRLDLQAADYRYGLESNFGYFLSPSLNVWYQHELGLTSRDRLTARAMAPLISWVARSPYMVNDDEFIENIDAGHPLSILTAFLADGKLVGWSQLQRLDASLDYRREVLPRLELGASYRVGFLRHTEPRALTGLANSIHFTTTVRL